MIYENGFYIFTRDEFRNWLRRKQFGRRVFLLQNHHTYIPNYEGFNGRNHIRLLDSMKRYHVNNNNFSDIAQHLTTFPDGTIGTGRSFEMMPAGIYGANKGAICMEHVGNFDRGGDSMTQEQKKTILFINALLARKFYIPIQSSNIVYHHWYDLSSGARHDGSQTWNVKTCPGSNFFKGNDRSNADTSFIPLIQTEFNFLKYPQWKIDCSQILVDRGMTYTLHEPDETISFGELGIMLNNYFEKVCQVDPIEYMLSKGIIKSFHEPTEEVTMKVLGWVLMNMENASGRDPMAFMLDNRYITSQHDPNKILNFWTFGAIINNILKQHPLSLPK